MAARLTVIISQSASRDGQAVDLEETLVAHLMMTPGLDATLIGPIETIHVDSTDFLCLSGFNHNFGFVSWLDEAAVADHWRRLGLPGTVARPGAVIANSNVPKPRVYHFQIDRKNAGANILPELQQLQQDRAVQTVGIDMGGLSPQAPVPMPTPTRAPKANGTSKLPVDPLPVKPTAESSEEDDDADEWQQLDQLVDDFDALDL